MRTRASARPRDPCQPTRSVSRATTATQRVRPPEQERARIQAELDHLNAAYEGRFGFRFVVFVAGRPRSEIVPELERRLEQLREEEIETGLRAVVDIARDRWRKQT